MTVFVIIYLVCIFIVSYMVLPLLNMKDVPPQVQRSIMLLVLFAPLTVVYYIMEKIVMVPVETIYNFLENNDNDEFDIDSMDINNNEEGLEDNTSENDENTNQDQS